MGFKEELSAEVRAIFLGSWDVQEANKVPAPQDLRLNQNHAKRLDQAVVMYADLEGSTDMVDNYPASFAAEVYKSYLHCASQIIKRNSGTITAYDGDRVMAVFYDGALNTNAVAAALELNYAVEQIIRPAYAFYGNGFQLRHVVGIDRSELHAARVGVRVDNDVVWVGKAANHAAKLCSFSEKPIWITKAVYDAMLDDTRFSTRVSTGLNMWQRRSWPQMGNAEIYCTTWGRAL